MNIPHVPVLYEETINAFKNINNGYIIDCTTGFAGHSSGLLSSNKNINLICNDQDDEALAFSKKRLEEFSSKISIPTCGIFLLRNTFILILRFK